MEQRPRHPQYTLEIFADKDNVKDVVKATLHTIFFHRYFAPIAPQTHDLLDTTLPAIPDVALATLIDERATALARAVDGAAPAHRAAHPGRGTLCVQFSERRRRKGLAGGYFFGVGRGDEDVVWEEWEVEVTVGVARVAEDEPKVRRAMEKSLQKTALKIVNIVNRDKDHIPLITTTDPNPFPYQILVNPKTEGWGQRMGIF